MADEKKFLWTAEMGAPVPVRNKDLMCRDCKNRYQESVLYCDGFRGEKPAAVLQGGECFRYKLED